jgi:hypothetical protein
MNTVQSYAGKGSPSKAIEPLVNLTTKKVTEGSIQHSQSLVPSPLTPFQAALLFFSNSKNSKGAYAAFITQGNIVCIDRLHNLQGHNPQINLSQVIRFAYKYKSEEVILASWVQSYSENPYAMEFVDEVDRQYYTLYDLGIRLVDNLRLSETGMYSYYGSHNGPYDLASLHGQPQDINQYYNNNVDF